MRAALPLLLVAACTPSVDAVEDDDGTDTEPETHTDAPDPDPVDDSEVADTQPAEDTEPEPACAPLALAPGDHELTLDHGGRSRSYLLHVPPTHDATAPWPLLLSFHGWLFGAEDQRSRTRANPHADAHGYLVAYPQGVDDSWAGGACCGTAVADDLDDVGFARAVVAHVAERACVDLDRVYATGFSNGGFLAHRLACQAGDTFAAAAPVSAMMTIDPSTCDTAHPVPLLHVHGTADVVVPSIGNPLFDYPTFDTSVARWRGVHGCEGAPEVWTQGRATCETWTGCEDGAELRACLIQRWPHEWPGASSPLPANDAIWSFVSRFQRTPP